jgi:hypothetical protein
MQDILRVAPFPLRDLAAQTFGVVSEHHKLGGSESRLQYRRAYSVEKLSNYQFRLPHVDFMGSQIKHMVAKIAKFRNYWSFSTE